MPNEELLAQLQDENNWKMAAAGRGPGGPMAALKSLYERVMGPGMPQRTTWSPLDRGNPIFEGPVVQGMKKAVDPNEQQWMAEQLSKYVGKMF